MKKQKIFIILMALLLTVIFYISNPSDATADDMTPILNLNGTTEGTFGIDGFYKFTITKPSKIFIVTDSKQNYYNIEVTDSQANTLQYIKVIHGYLSTTISLNSGTYYFHIVDVSDDDYTINCVTTSYTENIAEPNNSFASASSISGNVIQGFIADNDEFDYIKFTVPKTGELKSYLSVYDDTSIYFEIYDSNKKCIDTLSVWMDDDYETSKGSGIWTKSTSTVLPKGTYYGKVYAPRDRITNIYRGGAYKLKLGAGNTISTTAKTTNYSCSVKSQTSYYCYSNKTEVYFSRHSKADAYEIYRSTKKNSSYKLIRTIKDAGNHDFSLTQTIYDKKVKADKCYYYKVRPINYENTVIIPGKFSAPKAYWTSVSGKVKIKKTHGSTLKWNKVKKADVYLVEIKHTQFKGYNIFGNKVFKSWTEYHYVKGLSYKTKEPDVSPFIGLSMKVYAATKHGKYYYINKQRISKKK